MMIQEVFLLTIILLSAFQMEQNMSLLHAMVSARLARLYVDFPHCLLSHK